MFKVILFYKYVEIPDPERIVREHLDWCLKRVCHSGGTGATGPGGGIISTASDGPTGQSPFKRRNRSRWNTTSITSGDKVNRHFLRV